MTFRSFVRVVGGTIALAGSGVSGAASFYSLENAKDSVQYAETVCSTPDHLPVDCKMAQGAGVGMSAFTAVLALFSIALFAQGILLYRPRRRR